MGYNLNITRQEWWSDDGPDINLHEWLMLVETDPELTLTDSVDHDVLWESPSGLRTYFLYSAGRIFKKKPQAEYLDEVVAKMVQIANALGGRVQGDDGEIYSGPGKST